MESNIPVFGVDYSKYAKDFVNFFSLFLWLTKSFALIARITHNILPQGTQHRMGQQRAHIQPIYVKEKKNQSFHKKQKTYRKEDDGKKTKMRNFSL